MIAFTLLYGLAAVALLVIVAVVAYLLRGRKTAAIASAITLILLVAGLCGMIVLITRSM